MSEGPGPIDPRLRDALRAVAEADDERGAAASVETALRAELRARRDTRERRRQMVWLAAAAAIVMAVTAARWGWVSEPRQGTSITATVATQAPDAIPADFLPLAYAAVPVRSGQIVQMVVPAAAMESFGLAPFGGSDAVAADVFVGEDGLARAVRFSPLRPKELAQ